MEVWLGLTFLELVLNLNSIDWDSPSSFHVQVREFKKKNYMKPTQSSIPEHPPRAVEDDGSNPNKPKPIGQSEACHLPLNTEGSQHSFIRAV